MKNTNFLIKQISYKTKEFRKKIRSIIKKKYQISMKKQGDSVSINVKTFLKTVKHKLKQSHQNKYDQRIYITKGGGGSDKVFLNIIIR